MCLKPDSAISPIGCPAGGTVSGVPGRCKGEIRRDPPIPPRRDQTRRGATNARLQSDLDLVAQQSVQQEPHAPRRGADPFRERTLHYACGRRDRDRRWASTRMWSSSSDRVNHRSPPLARLLRAMADRGGAESISREGTGRRASMRTRISILLPSPFA